MRERVCIARQDKKYATQRDLIDLPHDVWPSSAREVHTAIVHSSLRESAKCPSVMTHEAIVDIFGYSSIYPG